MSSDADREKLRYLLEEVEKLKARMDQSPASVPARPPTPSANAGDLSWTATLVTLVVSLAFVFGLYRLIQGGMPANAAALVGEFVGFSMPIILLGWLSGLAMHVISGRRCLIRFSIVIGICIWSVLIALGGFHNAAQKQIAPAYEPTSRFTEH